MKYRIEEYKLKNGIEDISIIFDEKYQLLTTFMSCDVLPFEKWIKSGFDEWCDKVQKFKMSITTKPPTGRLNS